MMREIERPTIFKKDYKREAKGKYRSIIKDELLKVITLLAQDLPLDTKYRDHDLVGNWSGYRECHIKSDLLLIYKLIGDNVLRLARLGSHSELFG